MIPTVTIDQVPDPIPEGLTVLDVREPVEWQHAHIEGALHIPLATLPVRVAELPADQQQQAALHIADCDLCSNRLGNIELARQEFLKAPVPAWVQPKPNPFARVRRWWMAMVLVPAMAAGFLVLKPESAAPIDEGADDTSHG